MLLTVSTLASEYTSAKPLLLEAIDAPSGKAKGVLTGPVARQIASTTGSSSPILANVTTIKRLKQEGCRRLNLRLSQANVPTKNGKKTVLAMDYGFNMCRDGSPPGEE